MSLINEMTPVTALPELDLFSSAPVQTSIETSKIQEVRPISLLNTGGHIEFIINTGHNEYIRLDETTLYLKFRVKLSKTNNSAIEDTDWNGVSFVNNFLHSLWSQIDLQIGDTQTTLSLQTYPYRAYFETMLGSSKGARDTHLTATGFFVDDFSTSTIANGPQSDRMKYIKHSSGTDKSLGKVMEIEGKLHFDLQYQPKAIIGGTTLRIKLVPNKPEFYFMSSDSLIVPKLEFMEVYLNVIKSRVNNDVYIGHTAALGVSPAKYPITRSEVRSITIDKGVTGRNLENVINGQLPRRVFIAFVDNAAFNGSFTKNPFYFYHNYISSLACFVNGEQFPMRAYTPNFDDNTYLREYMALFKAANQLNNNARIPVHRDLYNKGYTIFGFNLSSDISEGYLSSGYVNPQRYGVLRFELNFSKRTEETINALVFCEFDNLISILEDRNAVMDYH